MPTAAQLKTSLPSTDIPGLSPDCLSEADLLLVADGESLPAEGAAHLNRCAKCQFLVSKMNAFNPNAIESAVAMAMDPMALSSRRRATAKRFARLSAAIVVGALLALLASRIASVRDDAEFERARADLATAELAMAQAELRNTKSALASMPTYVKGLGDGSATLWGGRYTLYANTASQPMQPGDIVVTQGDVYGHLAVVSSVRSATAYVSDLNWSTAGTSSAPSSATLALDANTGSYTWQSGPYSSSVMGWLRPSAPANAP